MSVRDKTLRQRIRAALATSRNHAVAGASKTRAFGSHGRVYIQRGVRLPGPPENFVFHDGVWLHRDPYVTRVNSPKYTLVRTGASNVVRLKLPDGAYNGSIVPLGERFIMAYRAEEFRTALVILDSSLNVQVSTTITLNFPVVDPRLYWHADNSRLLMFFSSFHDHTQEHIRCVQVMDRSKGDHFEIREHQRVSPINLANRQKNWTPFTHDGQMYLVSSICPHEIYNFDYDADGRVTCEKQYETAWKSSWCHPGDLRGNTNAIRLPDGNFLSTFHTAYRENVVFYDNGCYIFEGKPPFRVLRASADKPFLRAEDAVERYFRRLHEVRVCFPMSLIQRDDSIWVSYGDNDSSVKVLKTSLREMCDTTVQVV